MMGDIGRRKRQVRHFRRIFLIRRAGDVLLGRPARSTFCEVSRSLLRWCRVSSLEALDPVEDRVLRDKGELGGIGSRARERGYLSRRLLSGLAVALLRGLAGRAERRGEDRPGDALDRKRVV